MRIKISNILFFHSILKEMVRLSGEKLVFKKKNKKKCSFNFFALSTYAFIYLILREYCLSRFCFRIVLNAV